MTRVLFLAEKEVAFDDANVSGNLHNDAGFHGDCESVRGNDCLRDGSVNLHDGVKNARVNVNDDGFSHGDDENEESNEKGNDMTGSDDDDEIRSIRIRGDSHGSGDLMVSDDDESGGRIGDDDNLDHRIQGKCF